MNKQHLDNLQQLIDGAEFSLQSWKDARQWAMDMKHLWDDNPEVQEEVRQYLILNKAELTLAEIKLDECKEQLATARTQKVITLSSNDYDVMLDLISNEIDLVRSVLDEEEEDAIDGDERIEMEQDLEQLKKIEGLLVEQYNDR